MFSVFTLAPEAEAASRSSVSAQNKHGGSCPSAAFRRCKLTRLMTRLLVFLVAGGDVTWTKNNNGDYSCRP